MSDIAYLLNKLFLFSCSLTVLIFALVSWLSREDLFELYLIIINKRFNIEIASLSKRRLKFFLTQASPALMFILGVVILFKSIGKAEFPPIEINNQVVGFIFGLLLTLNFLCSIIFWNSYKNFFRSECEKMFFLPKNNNSPDIYFHFFQALSFCSMIYGALVIVEVLSRNTSCNLC